jgi:hypothetical protein
LKLRGTAFVSVAAVVVIALASASSTVTRVEHHGRDADDEYVATGPPREALELARGKEGPREGPWSAVAEQVDARAYPRSYVDDRDAQRARDNFDAKHRPVDRAAFDNDDSFARASTAQNATWELLGPVTPNVPGEATQFVEPDRGFKGPGTQESGRVAAMAIDPNCGKASAPSGAPCRLWVSTAGGGVWRTNNALATKPMWIAPPDRLPTNAFGALVLDANDPSGNTLYAGSGEPTGSIDSEAGLGLFKTSDGGATWRLVPGSAPVATNRAIGGIAVKPGDPQTIFIGTDVARHGNAAVEGGRRTPPDAPDLGVYKSTDGGKHFSLETDLQRRTPPNANPPASGLDWFQGGINKLQIDPNDQNTIYAGVLGYGLWRSQDSGTTWSQVFHTMNQSDAQGHGDELGDRTEFDAVDLGDATRIFLGDASDDLLRAEVYRTDDAAALQGDPAGRYDNGGWAKLSNGKNGTPMFLPHNYCQNYQCGYDDFVVSPASQPGVGAGHEATLWLGGSMNYGELPAYGPVNRSNGRGVIRSTNADGKPAKIEWADMTATLGGAPDYAFTRGLHPDQHAVVFVPTDPGLAFVGSDGGVALVDVREPQDKSAACATRSLGSKKTKPETIAANQRDCERLLSAIPEKITPVNDGLASIQFQSLSYNPTNPLGELLGGTQDNGTWAYHGTTTWLESIGGDGGQSGFDATNGARYHTYYSATPEVSFTRSEPREYRWIGDPLQASGEAQSFYPQFVADPTVSGRAFIGLEHVWRTNDNGGKDHAFLRLHCDSLTYFVQTHPRACGDWKALGANLTGKGFGGDRVGDYVIANVPAASDKNTMWAATKTGRLFVSENVAAPAPKVTFHRIDTPDTPGRVVTGIAIDPKNPKHAWISYNGYSAYTPSEPGHVFEVRYNSKTNHATFTDRSFDLGDQPITGIAFDGATADLFAATDFGVLRLPRGSSQWLVAGTGLPQVGVYALTISPDARVLYAATHGRAAWRLAL